MCDIAGPVLGTRRVLPERQARLRAPQDRTLCRGLQKAALAHMPSGFTALGNSGPKAGPLQTRALGQHRLPWLTAGPLPCSLQKTSLLGQQVAGGPVATRKPAVRRGGLSWACQPQRAQ